MGETEWKKIRLAGVREWKEVSKRERKGERMKKILKELMEERI
jgi:hypothetical protein